MLVAVLSGGAFLLVPAIPIPTEATTYAVRGIRTGEMDSLRALAERAKRSKGAAAEPEWYEVARYARDLADSHGDAKSVSEAEKILKDACDRLPASSLAAVAAWGGHPVVSAAFVEAVARMNLSGRGGDVSPEAEAASECRDALAQYGPERVPELLSRWKKFGRAGFGAGGASSSVYRIALFGTQLGDSASSDEAFVSGFRAGARVAAGPLADRFQVIALPGSLSGATARKFGLQESTAWGAGVLVIISGRSEADMATGLVAAGRIVAIDARNEESIDSDEVEVVPAVETFAPSVFGRPFPLRFQGGDTLRYLRFSSVDDGDEPGRYERWSRDFVASPMGIERARRLMSWIGKSGGAESVAVVAPELGGDVALARAVALARVNDPRGKTVTYVPFEYSPGRRDFGPEVRRFRETGCDGILFCGPPEETAEWLTAFASARMRPKIFGGSSLDPAGFHDAARRAAEGAVFVGSDWKAVGTVARGLAAAKSSAGAALDDAAFERGFLVATSIVRRVVEGNCTPGLLSDAISDESPFVMGMLRRMLNPGGLNREPGPPNAVVPLYRVHNGIAERIEQR